MASESQESSDVTTTDPAANAVVSSTLTHRVRTKEDKEKILLEQMVTRDTLHYEAIVQDQNSRAIMYNRRRDEIEDYKNVRGPYRQFFPPRVLYGEGYAGYGNGHTDGQTKLMYPNAKTPLGHRKTPKLKVKRKEMSQQADQVEELVPVRLEVDWDKVKLRDTFTWNLHDRTVTPELFAATLVEDLGLPLPASNPVLEQVQQQLREQLGDFYPQVYIEEDALDPELPYSAYKNEEMRILIKLNITIGAVTLEDKFEWEINNPMNSPEEFARSMTRELHLAGEFTTAIAHCIREQSQLFTRSLFIVGHPFDGRPLEDADLIASFLPSPLPSVLRAQQQAREFAPYLYELSEADLDRSEVIYSREQRRQKRSVNRRGGPTLPDLKDRQRTVRTLLVSKTLPGAADTVEESRLYKKVAVGRGKKGLQGGDLTESSDSEDSSPDSPAMSNLPQGTARTRGMRGAATAAQQRMANIGRSETPEASLAHHHETRTSARRYGGRDVREESLEPSSLIVKLRVGRDRLRNWSRDLKARSQPPQTPSLSRAQSNTAGTPVPGTMGPPTTPGISNKPLQQPQHPLPPSPSPAPVPQGQVGRIEALPPPAPGQPPRNPVSSSLIYSRHLHCSVYCSRAPEYTFLPLYWDHVCIRPVLAANAYDF
jgi:SWI/SNF-related matrix-associated actin-dependent regulator of chromatin subfamily B protein 1